jgi:lysyl-tRNA synthetase class 2
VYETDDFDFLPTASVTALETRAAVLRQLRDFFAQRGFLEVETPLLSRDTVVDLHLDPLAVTLTADPDRPSAGPRMWLQTSPEFAMKRLLAAGIPRIFQITKAFRADEQGARHNPEFTLVEWYRAGDGLHEGMDLLAALAGELLGASAVDRCSYRDAFQTCLGVDPLTASVEEFALAARNRDVVLPRSMSAATRDEWLNLLLAECVEPHLGKTRPLILFDYPASQAALARVRDEYPPVAERFELYVHGMELANGYHELLDPSVLMARNRAANAERAARGKCSLPEQSRLLAAMRYGLPACTGVALGLDRVLMAITGAKHIREVLAFPLDRA